MRRPPSLSLTAPRLRPPAWRRRSCRNLRYRSPAYRTPPIRNLPGVTANRLWSPSLSVCENSPNLPLLLKFELACAKFDGPSKSPVRYKFLTRSFAAVNRQLLSLLAPEETLPPVQEQHTFSTVFPPQPLNAEPGHPPLLPKTQGPVQEQHSFGTLPCLWTPRQASPERQRGSYEPNPHPTLPATAPCPLPPPAQEQHNSITGSPPHNPARLHRLWGRLNEISFRRNLEIRGLVRLTSLFLQLSPITQGH